MRIAHLDVQLGRVSTVIAEGVRVGNPADFPDDPPFAEVARATARLDLGAFLRSREVVVPSIELDRPVVNVIGKDGGARNYAFEFTPPAGETNAPEDVPAPRIGGAPHQRRQGAGSPSRGCARISRWTCERRTGTGRSPPWSPRRAAPTPASRIEAQFTGGSVLDLRDESRALAGGPAAAQRPDDARAQGHRCASR